MAEIYHLTEDMAQRNEMVDYEARSMAAGALQAIQSHERVCLERDRHADAQRTRMEKKIDALEGWQKSQLIAVICILVSAVTFFLIPYFRLHG